MKSFFTFLLLSFSSFAFAQTINVLAAANLSKALKEIKQNYLEKNPDAIVNITFMASGKAYAQIKNAAPVDLFVSADTSYPQKLFTDKLGTQPQVYAQGILVLWSKDIKVTNLDSVLNNQVKNIALPNPELAPYGRAGKEALQKSNLFNQVAQKIRQATSVSQSHQWVESKNCQIGFGALSLINQDDAEVSFIAVDSKLYEPIKQALILTNLGKDKPLAKDFAQFILESKDVFKRYGYLIP